MPVLFCVGFLPTQPSFQLTQCATPASGLCVCTSEMCACAAGADGGTAHRRGEPWLNIDLDLYTLTCLYALLACLIGCSTQVHTVVLTHIVP